MFDKSYFITQALLVLGIPIGMNGEDYSGNTLVGQQIFQRAMDDLANITDLKANAKRVNLVLDTNRNRELGIVDGDFGRWERWFILPLDFHSLVSTNALEYRIIGDYLATTNRNATVTIEYIGALDPADIENNQRNLLIYIVAKHIAIATGKDEKIQMCMGLIQNELISIRLNTPNRKPVDYFRVRLRR